MAEPDLRKRITYIVGGYLRPESPRAKVMIDELVTAAEQYAWSQQAVTRAELEQDIAAVTLDASKVGRIQVAGDADNVIMPGNRGLTLTLAPELVNALVGIIDALYEASTVEHPYVGTAPIPKATEIH